MFSARLILRTIVIAASLGQFLVVPASASAADAREPATSESRLNEIQDFALYLGLTLPLWHGVDGIVTEEEDVLRHLLDGTLTYGQAANRIDRLVERARGLAAEYADVKAPERLLRADRLLGQGLGALVDALDEEAIWLRTGSESAHIRHQVKADQSLTYFQACSAALAQAQSEFAGDSGPGDIPLPLPTLRYA